MTTYSDIQKDFNYQTDNNCCTVVAATVALNEEFSTIQQEFFKEGRKRNRGVMPSETQRIMKKLALARGFGFRVIEGEELRKLTQGKRMTCNNASHYLERRKNYVLSVRGHVAALKDGKIEDWTQGRKHYVKCVYEFTPPTEPVKVEPEQTTVFAQLVAAL